MNATWNRSDDDQCSNSYYLFQFSVNVIIGSLLVFIGLVGNIISIMVLSKDWSHSSMSVLLSVLGIYDIMFLILSIYYIILKEGILVIASNELYEAIENVEIQRYFLPIVWFFGNLSRCGRNWISVVVAIDRFIVVYRPFQALSRSNPGRSKMYSLVVALISLIYNIPRFWEWREEYSTFTNQTRMTRNPDLGRLYHLIYSSVLYSVMTVLGPMVFLIIFNTLLTISVIKASKRHRTLTKHLNHSTKRNHDTKMLVVVIGVFIVTELPSCVMQIKMTASKMSKTCVMIFLVNTFVNILAILNSSTNFFLYCMCGLRFRKNLRKLFLSGRNVHRNLNHGASQAGSICVSTVLQNSRHKHVVTLGIEEKADSDDLIKETAM